MKGTVVKKHQLNYQVQIQLSIPKSQQTAQWQLYCPVS
jgi:hypothetical protein